MHRAGRFLFFNAIMNGVNNTKISASVSIIVPVYRVEAYICSCLDSILAQSFTDWECILVDDGSLDKSGAICDEYSRKDSRFKVLHKQNSGVSAARNSGIEVAQGARITFVDSDDMISPDYLETMYKASENGQYDVIFANRSTLDKEDITPAPAYFPEGKVFTTKEDMQLLRQLSINSYTLSNSAIKISATWGKMYDSNIIMENNIRFNEGLIFCEDMCFLYEYLKYSRAAKFLPNGFPTYIYRVNEGSLTRTSSMSMIEKRYFGFFFVSKHIYPDLGMQEAVANMFLEQIFLVGQLIVNSATNIIQCIKAIHKVYSWPESSIVLGCSLKDAGKVFPNQIKPFKIVKTRLLFLFLLKARLKNK